MKKITLILSTLVVVSMLLVACGGQETSTSVPSTDVPPMTEEPTEEAPAETETGVPTEEGTPVGAIPVTGEEDPSRLSNQLDFNVWDQNGEQIGEVDDMVLDLDNSSVSYVIVGTGGFLDIGERDIFVPWDSLVLQTEGGDMTGGEQYAFILQADQEIFTSAPDIDVSTVLPAQGEPAGDWDAEIRNYWEGGVVPGTPSTDGTAEPSVTGTAGPDTTGTASPEATALPATTGTLSPDATAVPGEDLTTGELQGVVLATELLGSTITIGSNGGVEGADLGTGTPDAGNNQAQGTGTPEVATPAPAGTGTAMPEGTATLETGVEVQEQVSDATIDDVIVDVASGDILYLVLTAAFADGERWIPVPLDHFSWDAASGTFVLNVDQAMLSAAPFFPDGQYPGTMTEGWDSDYSSYWQNPGSGSGGADATATP